MLTIISPAKTLKTDIPVMEGSTFPDLLEYSERLVKELKNLDTEALAKLMKVSPKIASLNYHRFQQWHLPYHEQEGANALLAFRGEVFRGIDADSFSRQELLYSQKVLRILSGLYGVLRPLDIILPYRLEMGTKIAVGSYKNLYEFWKRPITENLNRYLKDIGSDFLINLASEEYFKSIDKKILKAKVITPVFKDEKNGAYKVITIYAKKARGLMTRFIIKNRITNPEELKFFDLEGYYYQEELSNAEQFVFVR
jgi:cytoplasmic iron level regulating protein YaaA (DUF328/UPF0246 family)